MSDLSTIFVSRTDAGFLVEVEGRATLKQSPSLQKFSEACAMSDQCDLVVDLDSCSYIDSTIAGCLITIFKRYKSKPSQFKLVASEERLEALLRQLGLHKYFPVIRIAPSTRGDPVLLTATDQKSDEFAKHVLKCHRELCSVEGPQQEVFQKLVEQIEREVRDK